MNRPRSPPRFLVYPTSRGSESEGPADLAGHLREATVKLVVDDVVSLIDHQIQFITRFENPTQTAVDAHRVRVIVGLNIGHPGNVGREEHVDPDAAHARGEVAFVEVDVALVVLEAQNSLGETRHSPMARRPQRVPDQKPP